ncbi:hypothetical protein NM688_g5343 [Phlebia brevispora]|uniref:Uncharacterized protein n=1 Tax=Phlebia brevispora TaxID=194682 RepID=A0ACC1SX25_9APHY|nr:hypothetical protein NM688_g5343 [Phlebia brevispora]
MWGDEDVEELRWLGYLHLGCGYLKAKDCLNLWHVYLTKREIESRHVKSRSFAGVDIKELDLIPGLGASTPINANDKEGVPTPEVPDVQVPSTSNATTDSSVSVNEDASEAASTSTNQTDDA